MIESTKSQERPTAWYVARDRKRALAFMIMGIGSIVLSMELYRPLSFYGLDIGQTYLFLIVALSGFLMGTVFYQRAKDAGHVYFVNILLSRVFNRERLMTDAELKGRESPVLVDMVFMAGVMCLVMGCFYFFNGYLAPEGAPRNYLVTVDSKSKEKISYSEADYVLHFRLPDQPGHHTINVDRDDYDRIIAGKTKLNLSVKDGFYGVPFLAGTKDMINPIDKSGLVKWP